MFLSLVVHTTSFGESENSGEDQEVESIQHSSLVLRVLGNHTILKVRLRTISCFIYDAIYFTLFLVMDICLCTWWFVSSMGCLGLEVGKG